MPIMGTPMAEKHLHLLRLLHLASPSLPTGAFAYSQGLEWAIAAGWVWDAASLEAWLADLLRHSLARVEIPLLARMVAAVREHNESDLARWCDQLLALRETNELRLEEKNRGRAMACLLEGLKVHLSPGEKAIVAQSQLAGFALAAARWEIPLPEAAAGYAWSWLENQTLAGIKTIPLGQTEGHRILLQMDETVITAVALGLGLETDAIGVSSPALAIASSLHETQYTRLFRS
jgi:urease accessory protein